MLTRGLWAIVQGSAGLLVTCFLIGYAAPYLPPHPFWWANLLAVGLWPLALGTGLVTLALAGTALYRRRWLPGGIALVLALLLASRFGPSLGERPPSSPSEGLRVMSFNVPGMHTGDGAALDLAALLARERPSVLALQESRVHTPASSDRRISVSPSLQEVFRGSTGYTLPQSLPYRTVIQQPVFGRILIDSLRVHPLPPNGDASARSRFTQTYFRWENRPVMLFNLHLHTVGRMRPWDEPGAWADWGRWKAFLRTYRTGVRHRADQARVVRRAIDRAAVPVLVTGDFNSTRHQWAYRHIAQGLQDAVEKRGRGWTATFPAGSPLVRIDHILAGPEWHVRSAKVPSLDGYEGASDHRPVVATLQWRPRPPE